MSTSDVGPNSAGDSRGDGKGAQTRRAVLDAAIERFGRDGYRSTSVADIARDAGIGATGPYAYFPNKEALFLAALDEDAAAVINVGLGTVLEAEPEEWRETLIFTLITAVDQRPLARRVLSGLEPHVSDRIVAVPVLDELRKAVADRIREDQLSGKVRSDIDPEAIAHGSVAIIIAVLMTVLQLGTKVIEEYGMSVLAVFEAALHSPASRS